MLGEEEIREIQEEMKHYPDKRAAGIEAMKVVQKKHRWVSDEHLKEIASMLDMSFHELDSVATFYNLVFRQPVGRHVILLCSSISCWVLGYKTLLDHISTKLGIQLGQTTPDERFTLLHVPCLGTCDHAPALLIDDDLHRDLTIEKVDQILDSYK